MVLSKKKMLKKIVAFALILLIPLGLGNMRAVMYVSAAGSAIEVVSSGTTSQSTSTDSMYQINIGNCGTNGSVDVDLTFSSSFTSGSNWSLSKESGSIYQSVSTDEASLQYMSVERDSRNSTTNGVMRLTVSGSAAAGTVYRVSYTVSSWYGSQTYYFYAKVVSNPLSTVPQADTVDNPDAGITMKMYDFSLAQKNDMTNNALGNSWQSDGGMADGRGQVQNTLDSSGCPVTTSKAAKSNVSLSKWFTNVLQESGGLNVNNLFQKDSDGYLYYDCTKNYAALNTGTGRFTLFKALGTPLNNISSLMDKILNMRGNFLPYNTIGNEYSANLNTYDIDGHLLTSGDSGYGQHLYIPNEAVDYYFGMYMNAQFIQPKSGLVNSKAMTFEFTGDDDMWVFIDGKLVLDLGGIHIAQSATINFHTGQISYTENTVSNNQLSSDPDAYPSTLKSCLSLTGDTFDDYSVHTITMFYMERGAGASTLKVKFNMPTIPKGTVDVTKQVKDLTSSVAARKDYQFKLYVNGSVKANTAYTLRENDKNVGTGTTDGSGTFTLKDGQTARFADIPDSDSYYVTETTPDGCDVTFNDASPKTEDKTNGVYTSPTYQADATRLVTCTNDYAPVTAALQILKTDEGSTPLKKVQFQLAMDTGTGDNQVWTPVTSSESNPKYFTTGTDGTAEIDSLPAGSYKLSEVAPPDGFLDVAGDIYFTVSSTGAVTLKGSYNDNSVSLTSSSKENRLYILKDVNMHAYTLPETGGGGTAGIREAGAGLCLLALAGFSLFLLIRRKRRGIYAVPDRKGGTDG